MRGDDKAAEEIAQLLMRMFHNPEDGPHVEYVVIVVDKREPNRQLVTSLHKQETVDFLFSEAVKIRESFAPPEARKAN